jgi:hypothetical protein
MYLCSMAHSAHGNSAGCCVATWPSWLVRAAKLPSVALDQVENTAACNTSIRTVTSPCADEILRVTRMSAVACLNRHSMSACATHVSRAKGIFSGAWRRGGQNVTIVHAFTNSLISTQR